MSSRHRRMQTLKYFDKHYRRGQRQSANTGTDKPLTTPTSTTGDTPIGCAPCPTGIHVVPSSGRAPSSSLDQNSWDRLMRDQLRARNWVGPTNGQWEASIPHMGRLEGVEVSGVEAQEAPRAEEYRFNQIRGSLSEWHRMRRDHQRMEAERAHLERARNQYLLYQAMSTPGIAIRQDHERRTYTFRINGEEVTIPTF